MLQPETLQTFQSCQNGLCQTSAEIDPFGTSLQVNINPLIPLPPLENVKSTVIEIQICQYKRSRLFFVSPDCSRKDFKPVIKPIAEASLLIDLGSSVAAAA